MGKHRPSRMFIRPSHMSDNDLKALIDSILPEVRELRHDLHRHPELAFEEERTAGKVLEFLDGLGGMEIRPGIAGTGLAITVGGHLPGPCVALRADMDALPIQEASGVEWSSRVPGKMHACGHDGHTAMLAGAARILAANPGLLGGPVKFLFQPAEEGDGGGYRMIQEGALKNPPVEAVFGLHNNFPLPDMEIGSIAYASGPAMAGTHTFEIEISGHGGHAAFPHLCIDPVYIGSCIVTELQGLVSRSINPLAPAVLSVTRFHAGTANNIIPPVALLSGTIRALDMVVLADLKEGLIRRATEIARAHGAVATVEMDSGYPVLVNDSRMESVFLDILDETGDAGSVIRVDPVMGGEDFAFYALQVPSFFYFLPACPAGVTDNPACHHPAFDFNDDLLATGIRLHVETARRFARHWLSEAGQA